MAGGTRFCTARAGECTTASHDHLKGLVKELPGGKDGVWSVMAKSSPCLPESDLYQPNLGSSRAEKSSGFEYLLMQR